MRIGTTENKEGGITSKTRVCAVIAENVTYSLSPDMHNRGYEALGINDCFVYEAHSVSKDELGAAVGGFRALQNYRGVSVGVPHKQAVMEFLDEIDPAAKKIGAVNTIVIDRKDGKKAVLTGYNTDWIGVREPLRERIPSLEGKKVVILGAGGAARAALYAVTQERATVKVYNRTLNKAKALAKEFGCGSELLDKLSEIKTADIIIHATYLGMKPDDPLIIPEELIQPNQVVFDVVYVRDRPTTHLVDVAKKRGATVIPGREMLLWQGVEQFKLFTEQEPPIEVMRRVLIYG